MADMFDDITAANIASYWETIASQEAPYLGEVLFPNTTSPDSQIAWYRGQTRAPKPLALSAFDAQAIPRDRQGFSKVTTETRFFKESKYIDEAMRQQLLRAQNSTVPAQKDFILNRIFQDSTELVRGAALSREIMRMQLLQTGKINISSNGQAIIEDYGMKADHFAKATGVWGQDGSNPADDLRKAIDLIGTQTGQTLSRAVITSKVLDALLRDPAIKATILANNANTSLAMIPKSVLLAYLSDEFGISFQVYDKTYMSADGTQTRFLADGNVVLMPEVALGSTTFSPTPEQADLQAQQGTDVTVTDTGVAITTIAHADPVTKETKVTQQVIPTFEQIDSVYVLNALAADVKTTQVTGGTGSAETPPEA